MKDNNSNTYSEEYKMLINTIRYERIRNKYTQKDLANYLNISLPAYSRYESFTTKIPLDIVLSICKLFHISVDKILDIEEGVR